MKSGKLNIYLDFILLLILTLASIIVFRMWTSSVFLVGKIVVKEGEALDLCRLVLLNIGKENYVRTGNLSIEGTKKEMHFLDLKVCADCNEFHNIINEMNTKCMESSDVIACKKGYISKYKCPLENCKDGADGDGDCPGDTNGDGKSCKSGDKGVDEFYPETDCGYAMCYVTCEWFENLMKRSYPGLGKSVKMLKFEIGNCGDCIGNSCNCNNEEDDDDDGKIDEYNYNSPSPEAEYICGDKAKICPTNDFVECNIPLYGTKETGKLTICALR